MDNAVAETARKVLSQRSIPLFVLTVFAAVLVAGCATHMPQDIGAFAPQSLDKNVVGYSSEFSRLSKVVVKSVSPMPIKDLVFLFEKNGKYYVNLTYSHSIDKPFSQTFPNNPPYGFATTLTSQQQTWVLQRCTEKIGDSFSTVDLINGRTESACIRGVSGYAEGGNGDIGFIGELDLHSIASSSPSDDIFGETIAGFAFPAAPPSTIKFKPMAVLNMKRLARIQKLLRSALQDPECYVLDAIRNSDDGAILAIAEYARRSCEPAKGFGVFYLMPVKKTYRVIPFAEIPYAVDTEAGICFPLDIYPGCGKNTCFCFLPDIDRDGRGELLVICREGFVFKIVEQHDAQNTGSKMCLYPFRNFHYGMRE